MKLGYSFKYILEFVLILPPLFFGGLACPVCFSTITLKGLRHMHVQNLLMFTKNAVHVECGHGWASDVHVPGMWYDKDEAGCGRSNTMTWYKSHRGDGLASAHCCRVALARND